jgi:hypothetical protein
MVDFKEGIVDKTLEKNERQENKVICGCGCDQWRIYTTVIIDDARLYCIKCGKEWGDE